MSAAPLPARFDDVEALDEFLSRPTADLERDIAKVDGDIMVLGVAGKMGPTLARMAKRAAPDKRVIGVARFTDPSVSENLRTHGVEAIAADLLDQQALERLPLVRNVIFAAGHKFGAQGNPALTWAMNTYLPAMVAKRFHASRLVAFSTGNVYPLSRIGSGGASEQTLPAPVGEYAQSCLGRERMFEYFGAQHHTEGRLFRLNYAVEMRYGVLVDIAQKIARGDPVDVTMGHVNVIWQGDANAQVLRCLAHTTQPISPINCTGPETLSVRWLVEQLAARMGREGRVKGQEAETALLSDTTQAARLFGYPQVPLGVMLDWVADWVVRGGATHGKPTKFEVRDGTF